MEWKFKVGDVLKDGVGDKFIVIGYGKQLGIDCYICNNGFYQKYLIEEMGEIVESEVK